MRNETGPGQVEVSFSYSRHIGPKYVHGGVTLRFDALKPYEFVSRVLWPGSDRYDSQIREAVEEVLREKQGHLESPWVILTEIEWDEIASCENGFRMAAMAATRAAFEV